MIKGSVSRRVFLVINAILLCVIGICCFAPMWHVICCSVSDPSVLMREQGFLVLPKGNMDFSGYGVILNYKNIWTGYYNTLIYVLSGVAFNLILTSVAAYVLSRKRFLLRNGIMLYLSFTMLFNGGLIPNYLLILKLGMLNTRWAIILPNAFSVFNLVIMRTAFLEVPEALDESARLEGANDLQVLLYIILPVTKATLAVIALFVAVFIWNSWFQASIYLSDHSKWPLQMFLQEILISNSQRSIESGVKASVISQQTLIKYCTIVVATLPILCLYPFLQKYFVKGMMIGSVKG